MHIFSFQPKIHPFFNQIILTLLALRGGPIVKTRGESIESNVKEDLGCACLRITVLALR